MMKLIVKIEGSEEVFNIPIDGGNLAELENTVTLTLAIEEAMKLYDYLDKVLEQ